MKPSRYQLFDATDELVYECDELDDALKAAHAHVRPSRLELFENDKHGIMRSVGWFAAR